MVVGTALGFSQWGTVALSVALAFLFGYSLTSLPLLRAGLALSAVVPIALATDTFSIAVMEVVDNAIMVDRPRRDGRRRRRRPLLGHAVLRPRRRGRRRLPRQPLADHPRRGHAVLHNSGHHPDFPVRLVGAVAVAAFLFGSAVLLAEALGDDPPAHGHAPPLTHMG